MPSSPSSLMEELLSNPRSPQGFDSAADSGRQYYSEAMKQWNQGYRVKDYTPFGTDVFHDQQEKLKRVSSWDAGATSPTQGHDLDPMAGRSGKYYSIHDFGVEQGMKGVSSQPVLNTVSQGTMPMVSDNQAMSPEVRVSQGFTNLHAQAMSKPDSSFSSPESPHVPQASHIKPSQPPGQSPGQPVSQSASPPPQAFRPSYSDVAKHNKPSGANISKPKTTAERLAEENLPPEFPSPPPHLKPPQRNRGRSARGSRKSKSEAGSSVKHDSKYGLDFFEERTRSGMNNCVKLKHFSKNF